MALFEDYDLDKALQLVEKVSAEADSGDETASDCEEADGADADAEDEDHFLLAEDNEEFARGTSPGQGA